MGGNGYTLRPDLRSIDEEVIRRRLHVERLARLAGNAGAILSTAALSPIETSEQIMDRLYTAAKRQMGATVQSPSADTAELIPAVD